MDRAQDAEVEGPPDGDHISVIMLSLHEFERTLRWAMQQFDDFEEIYGTTEGSRHEMSTTLRKALECFPAARSLIIMVDVVKEPISLDEIQVVGGNDPALLRMGGHAPYRCHAAYQTYEMLHDDILYEYIFQASVDSYVDDQFWPERALPEVSFAFLRDQSDVLKQLEAISL